MSSIQKMSTSLESIVNYIRNVLRKEGITGMDSINHCIAFIVCRMFDKDICNRFKIDEKYSYEKMMKTKNGKEIGNQDLYNIFYSGNAESFIGQLVTKLEFKNIKFKLVGIENLKDIMKKLKEFDPKNIESKYDIIGTIYEIHLKSGTSNAMRDLGQYYTHRLVIEYMIKLCDPKMENGKIEKIVDPTMGTGGFLTMSIKYLNEKYKNKIDWIKNKNEIIGFDIDDNVRNMALLNIFMETGQLLDETICKQDTLEQDMKFEDGTVMEKAKIILANEPMGLKNIIFKSCCPRIQKGIKGGTKAEPLFLKLFMEALDNGGRCAVIVPDGMLFNDSSLHNFVRKKMIEDFNLKKVISLNDDFFLNTGVKTSIIFFVKDGTKTKEVEFSELKIKDDIVEENTIIFAKYDDIKKNNYSLFANKYNIKEQEKIKGIEYKKLSDILIKKNGKSLSKNNIKNGIYPVISGGVEYGGYHNEYNYDEKLIFIARVGSAGHISKYNNKCFVTDLVGAYAVVSDENVLFEYVYYYLKDNEGKIKNNYVMKTGAPSINLGQFIEKYEIPIPSLDVQKKIVDTMDILNNNIEICNKQNYELNNLIMKYIEYMTFNSDDIKLTDVCTLNKENLNGNNGKKYKFINYVDIGCIKNNKISGYEKIVSNFPSRAKRIFKVGDILLSTVRPNLKKIAYVNNEIENGICSTGFCVIEGKTGTNNKYIYYQILSKEITDYLVNNATGSHYPSVNVNIIENMKIKYPSKEIQNIIVEYCDNLQNIIDKNYILIENCEKDMKIIIDKYINYYGKKKEHLPNNDVDSNEDKKPKK